MFKFKYILTIFIIVILWFVYQKYYPDFENAIKQKDSFIENKQVKPILSSINQKLLESLETLDSDSTNLQDWFDNLNKNNIVVLDNNKYYFYVFEKISSEATRNASYQVKVHNSVKFLNMFWEDMFEQQENNFVFVREKTNKDLLYNMYSSASVNDQSKTTPTLIRYYWTDPIKNKLTLKEAVVHKWQTKDGSRSGIIGMGYTVKELSDKIKIQYKDFINVQA